MARRPYFFLAVFLAAFLALFFAAFFAVFFAIVPPGRSGPAFMAAYGRLTIRGLSRHASYQM